jgi:hypothetical protein
MKFEDSSVLKAWKGKEKHQGTNPCVDDQI